MEPGHPREPGADPGSRLLSRQNQDDLRAAILVGGSSTRMGLPKATLQLPDDELLLDRVCRAVDTMGLPITLVGRGPVTEKTACLERVPDAPGIEGPLAGILGAMDHDPDVAWVILACDLPLIRADGVRWLIDQRGQGRRAILPRLSERRVEPLFALYEPDARELLRRISQSGSPAPKRLAELDEVQTPEPPQALRACWTNINTPDELAALGVHSA